MKKQKRLIGYALVFTLSSSLLFAQNTSWDNPGTGNWSDPLNWNGGVPNASTLTVFANDGGTINASSTGMNSGDSLLIQDNTLNISRDMTSGQMFLSGSAQVNISGTQTLEGLFQVDGSGSEVNVTSGGDLSFSSATGSQTTITEGSVTLDGGTFSTSVGGISVFIGNTVNTRGTTEAHMYLQNGATLDLGSNGLTVGGQAGGSGDEGRGTLHILGDSPTINLPGAFTLNTFGTLNLQFDAGGAITPINPSFAIVSSGATLDVGFLGASEEFGWTDVVYNHFNPVDNTVFAPGVDSDTSDGVGWEKRLNGTTLQVRHVGVAIPEPSTAFIMMLGFGILYRFRRQ